jgi:hypothetical protein
MPTRGPQIRQHATHAQLVGHTMPEPVAPDDGPPPPLDAIVVPASRPAHNLDHAITLARATNSQLVVLCSHATRPAEVHDLLAARSFSAASVIEIPAGYSHEFFEFETTDWVRKELPAVCAGRDSDLSVKRNVGLVLARMLGWRRIFFMDDDIRDLDAAVLRSTVSLLAGDDYYHSAAMSTDEFPDNSVVCHARRAIGEFQGVFVSGSALAVDCTVSFSFFPDIYNEDWLFFYQDAAKGRLGHPGHFATQLRYNPFADPQRAAGQEFGDVIAEGLYALLEEGLGADQATGERWEQFLADRKRILEEILERSDMAPRDIQADMRLAVQAALKCLREIQPEMCADYVQRWRRDAGQWERTLGWLPQVDSVTDALLKLGLPPAAAGARHNLDRYAPDDYHEYFVGLAASTTRMRGFGGADEGSPTGGAAALTVARSVLPGGPRPAPQPSSRRRRTAPAGTCSTSPPLVFGIRGTAECRDGVELSEVSGDPSSTPFAVVGFTDAPVVSLLGFLRLELRVGTPDPPHPPMLTCASNRRHVIVEVGPKYMVEIRLPEFGEVDDVAGRLDGEASDITVTAPTVPFWLDLGQVPGR